MLKKHFVTYFCRAILVTALLALLALLALPVCVSAASLAPASQPKDAPPQTPESELAALCNEERERRGLPPLVVNGELARVARYKSEDMKSNGYFDHRSPVYGSPFDMMQYFNIPFCTVGENIAAGRRSAQAVMGAWMRSAGHRANILNPSFTQAGIGFCESEDGVYWTLILISE